MVRNFLSGLVAQRRHGVGADLMVQSFGTALSQLLPLAVAPVLTRLYAPEAFGVYGTIFSASAILAIVITLRIDHGIMVAKSAGVARRTAETAVTFALIGTGLLTLCVPVVTWLLGFGTDDLIAWTVLVPMGAFIVALMRTVTLYNNRLRRFSRVSVARIVQAVLTAAVSIGLGALTASKHGLIIGFLAGQFSIVLFLVPALRPFSVSGGETIRRTVRENLEFIRFSTLASLVNVLSWRLPFLLLPLKFSLEVTGYLALAYTVVATPTRFIGTAIGEVFYSHAARMYEQTGSCWPLARKLSIVLALFSVAGFTLLFLVAPTAFRWVFGLGWDEAAAYTRILIPMIAIRFVASPLSTVFYIAGRQKADFKWQLGLLVTTAAAMCIGIYYDSPRLALIAFAGSGCIMYIISFVMIVRFSSTNHASSRK